MFPGEHAPSTRGPALEERLEEALDHLYELPLPEFIAARNELAKLVRKAAGADAARAVGALRKPSRTAWALNQIARRRPEEVAALLDATERSRAASLEGDATALRASVRERGQVVSSLARAAAAVLQEAGVGSGRAQLDRIRDALLAAAADLDAAPLLRSGRLTETPSGAGFDAAFGASTSVAAPSATEAAPAADDPGRLARLREEAEEAEAHAHRLEEVAGEAEAHARRLRARAEEASSEAEQARAAAARARAEADEAGDRARG